MINFGVIVFVIFCFAFVANGEDRRTGTGPDGISRRILTGSDESRSSLIADPEEMDGRITYPNDFLIFHQHHHHNTDTDSGNFSPNLPPIVSDYDSDDSVGVGYAEAKMYNNASRNEIPLDFIKNINKYNVSDLLLNFVEGDMEYDEPFIRSRFGEDYEARSAAVMPKPAGCTPELTTISLATSDDPGILYIPQCTKVERCNGCCSHSLLSCQPKETETLTYQVLRTQYTGAKKLKFIGKEIILVEKHIKCKCDCKIKEEHCNKYQEYKPSECRCACTNSDEEKKCDKSGSKKLWNSELCACQCRDFLQCSTGYYFDQIECKCIPNPKRRFVNYNRNGYVAELPTISPLSDN